MRVVVILLEPSIAKYHVGVWPVAYLEGYKRERESPVGSLLSTERGTTSVPADRRRMRLRVEDSSPLNASRSVDGRTLEYPPWSRRKSRRKSRSKSREKSIQLQRRLAPSA